MNLLEYSERNSNFLTLGLDIGHKSIGWAIASGEIDGEKTLIDYGAHIFQEAIEEKKDTPASIRRAARHSRRKYLRTRNRNKKVFQQCLEFELIDKTLKFHQIDSFFKGVKNRENIFELRKRALDCKISNEELFQIIYSFSNHRGKSNRYDEVAIDDTAKDNNKDEEEKVNFAIERAKEQIDPNGKKPFRTYGEYACALAKENNGKYRNSAGNYRYSCTFAMLQEELSLIFQNQHVLGNEIASKENLEKLISIIFFQRALKSVEKQVGLCSYQHDKGYKRGTKSSYAFFRYSLLNDMANISIHNTKTGECNVRLTHLITSPEHYYEIEKAIIKNTAKDGMLVSKILPLISKDKGWVEQKIHESKKENTKISINEKFIELYEVLSHFYTHKEIIETQDVLAQTLSYEMDVDEWKERFKKKDAPIFYHVDNSVWKTIIKNNAGFGSLSIETMNEISTCMINSITKDQWQIIEPYEAKKRCGFTKSKNTIPFTVLPPLEMDSNYMEKIFPKVYPYVKPEGFTPFRNDAINPRVKRILAELRKLVNFLIKKYGKVPDRIVIETARETNTKADAKRIRKNQKADKNRNDAIKQFKGDLRKDGELFRKYKLWFQQNKKCAYSGGDIFECDIASCEIEHAVPQSIFFTSRDKNLLLVKEKQNQNKGNQFHIQFLEGQESEKWKAFVARINNSNMSPAKKAWLTNVDIVEKVKGMSLDRYLDNTKHASVAAMKYLRYYLYPSEDIHGTGSTNSVMSINGEATALLRKSVWKFPYVKDRETHYHHAIDAITIAAVSHKTKDIIQKHFKEIELKKKDKKEAEKSPYAEPINKIVQRVEEEFASNKRYVSHSTKYSFNQRGHEATTIGIPKSFKGNVTKNTPTQNKKSLEKVFISFFGKETNNVVTFDLKSSYEEREIKMLSIVKNPNIDGIQKNTILDITPDGMIKSALQQYARLRYQQEILRDQYRKELEDVKESSNDPDEEDRIKSLKERVENEIGKTITNGVVIQRGKKKTTTVVKSCVVVAGKAIGSHVVIKKGDQEFLHNTKGATHFDVYYCGFGEDKGYKYVPQFFGEEKNFFAITRKTNQIDIKSDNFKYRFSLYGGEILKISTLDEAFYCKFGNIHITYGQLLVKRLNTNRKGWEEVYPSAILELKIVKQQIDGTIKKAL